MCTCRRRRYAREIAMASPPTSAALVRKSRRVVRRSDFRRDRAMNDKAFSPSISGAEPRTMTADGQSIISYSVDACPCSRVLTFQCD